MAKTKNSNIKQSVDYHSIGYSIEELDGVTELFRLLIKIDQKKKGVRRD